MYNYILGTVMECLSNAIVLDNQGIGYQIYVANPFCFEEGKEAKVYIYNHIREDENTLYGFQTKAEKELFLKLLGVKGVGPKLILPMLATGSVEGIIDAMNRENILYLKKFPKVGEKVARQIILDLKGKLTTGEVVIQKTDTTDELVSVLEGLGYKNQDIKRVLPQVDQSLEIEKQIKEALRLLLK